ncbi:MAG: cytochrome c peroxidase [Mariprofundaceae bacterium]
MSILLALLPLSVAHADDVSNTEAIGQHNLSHWLLPDPPFPAHNPYSESKAKLGKVIFFDPRLSHNKNTSCLSCHNPGLAWADGMERSELAGLHAMPRHTPSLINVAYRQNFFWDGRAASLEHAVSEHLQAIYPDTRELIEEIIEIPGYRTLFSEAFGSKTVSLKNISAALATYLRTIVQRDTRFDRWIRGDKKAISDQAQRGFSLFVGKAKCIACHTPPRFSDGRFHQSSLYSIDPGRYEVSHKDRDRNAFRTPSLRQVSMTAPYMHAGQKPTLSSVIRYYNAGDKMPDDKKSPLGLNRQEMQDLEAFLNSLTGDLPAMIMPVLPVRSR